MFTTVNDFIFYCTEPTLGYVCIFSLSEGKDVYAGTLEDVPEEYRDCEIQSIDPVNEQAPHLTLNID